MIEDSVATKAYRQYIDDLGIHLDNREFKNGAKIWNASRNFYKMKENSNKIKHEDDMNFLGCWIEAHQGLPNTHHNVIPD